MQLSEREGLELWRRAVTGSVRSDAPDMTARQQAILMTVALTPGPHTVRALAAKLDIAKPAVTRALDALTKMNFIRRIRDENDLRNVFIERTTDGMDHLRAFAGLIVDAAAGKPVGDVAKPDVREARAA